MSHLAFAAKESGVEADTLSRSLGIFNRNLTVSHEEVLGFTSSASTFTKVMDSIGIATEKIGGGMRPTIEVLGDLADKFQKLGPGEETAGLAMQLFGRNGAAMLPFLLQGRQGIADLNAEADKLGVTMSQKDVDAAHEFTLASRQLEEGLKGVEIGVAQKVVPGLTQLSRAFTEGLSSGEKFTSFMKGAAFMLAALWTDAMILIANQVESILERVLNLWRDMMKKLQGDINIMGVNLNPMSLLPTMPEVHIKRTELIDPMQGLKNLFPDITKPVKDLGDKSGDTAEALSPLPEKIKDTRTSLDLLKEGLSLTEQAASDLFKSPTRERATENLHLDSLNAALDGLKDKFQPALDKLSDFKDGLSQAKDKLDAWGDDIDRRKGIVSDAQQAVQDHIDALKNAKGDLTKANDPAGVRGAQIDQAIAIDERRIKGMELATRALDAEDKQRQKQAKALDDQGKLADRQTAAVQRQITLGERQVSALERTTKLEDDRQKIMQDELTLANQTLQTNAQRDRSFGQLLTDTQTVTGRIRDTARAMGSSLIPSIDQVHQIAMKSSDVLKAIRDVTAKHDAATASIDRMASAADRAAGKLDQLKMPASARGSYTDSQGVLRGGGPQSIKPPDVGDAGLALRSRGYAN